ncbi:hypothetical protein U9M48_004856 [Paspalum notatum var. saurae]|uniref:Uncharacterized protein n=1 Tax=Paspalum notatum var. saurae TaxID=547442 RepID=A0AAQ3PNT7_PASNO
MPCSYSLAPATSSACAASWGRRWRHFSGSGDEDGSGTGSSLPPAPEAPASIAPVAGRPGGRGARTPSRAAAGPVSAGSCASMAEASLLSLTRGGRPGVRWFLRLHGRGVPPLPRDPASSH